jgi:hypothetical protein
MRPIDHPIGKGTIRMFSLALSPQNTSITVATIDRETPTSEAVVQSVHSSCSKRCGNGTGR